jgi:hypothetical protein
MVELLTFPALFIATVIAVADIWMRTRGEIDRLKIRRLRRATGR